MNEELIPCYNPQTKRFDPDYESNNNTHFAFEKKFILSLKDNICEDVPKKVNEFFKEHYTEKEGIQLMRVSFLGFNDETDKRQYNYHYQDNSQLKIEQDRLDNDFKNGSKLAKQFWYKLSHSNVGIQHQVPTGFIDIKSVNDDEVDSFDIQNYVCFLDKYYCYNVCLANVFHYLGKKTAAIIFRKNISVDPCKNFENLSEKEKVNLTNDRYILSCYMLDRMVKGVRTFKIKENNFNIFEHQ